LTNYTGICQQNLSHKAIGVMVIVDIIQGRYQKKLDLARKRGR